MMSVKQNLVQGKIPLTCENPSSCHNNLRSGSCFVKYMPSRTSNSYPYKTLLCSAVVASHTHFTNH
jgi:hypothetical protein